MQYLKVITQISSIRAPIISLEYDDPEFVFSEAHFEQKSFNLKTEYKSINKILVDGWKLVGPPSESIRNAMCGFVRYEWWFVK